MNERDYTVQDFIDAAETDLTFINRGDFEIFHDGSVVLRFPGFYNLNVIWNESFVRWETQINRLINDEVRIELYVKTAPEIIKLIENGFKDFILKTLDNA